MRMETKYKNVFPKISTEERMTHFDIFVDIKRHRNNTSKEN